MQSLRQLLRYLPPYRWYVVMNIVCNILMVLFSVISIPMLIPFLQILLGQEVPPTSAPIEVYSITGIKEWFYFQLGEIVVHFGKERALIYVCVLLIVVFFFKNLFKYLSLYFITPVRNGIIRDLRSALYDKTLRLPLSYFSEERKGDLMSRAVSDVQEVEWSILNVLETVVREPLMIIGSVCMMILINPSMILFVLGLMLFVALVIGGVGRTLKKQSTAVQNKLGDLVSVLEETLSGLRVIKGFNAENYQNQKFQTENNAYKSLQTKALRRRDVSSPLTETLGIATVCVLVWFGFRQVNVGNLTPQSFLAFLYAFFTILEPAKAFSTAYYNIQKGKAALDRIDVILNAPLLIEEAKNPNKINHFEKEIRYKGVTFRYASSEKNILDNIDLTIPKGQIVALVGASGAGKSTIADLLPRFYDVSEGKITIDGTDIRQTSLQDLRSFMGIVTQEATLFNDTIYNNIVFGLENITQEQVIAAAIAANAHEFIQNSPEGYETNIGDRGTKLSGGQRQRLTIARALLRNPQILILDEATSALDSESEKLVQAALQVLMQGRTALVIAHRLSTVQHADKIVVLNQGKIVEQGTHEQLLALHGEYRKLVDLQGLV